MNRTLQSSSRTVAVLGLLLATTLVAAPSLADDLSASLSGGGQGVASIRTLNASNLEFSLFADVGNITSADIVQGNAVVLNLGSNFGSSAASGSAGGNVSAIAANPGNYAVRVTGSSGTATGDLVFAAESGGGGGPGPGDGRVDTGDTSPCGQSGNGCALDNQYDVRAQVVNQQGQTVQATAVPFTNDTVLFYAFDETNIEFLVKVLDTCVINGIRWVFAGGATDLAGEIGVREVATGLERVYTFDGGAFTAINDTQEAHPCPEV